MRRTLKVTPPNCLGTFYADGELVKRHTKSTMKRKAKIGFGDLSKLVTVGMLRA